MQRGGYGVLRIDGKMIGAHILACTLAHGDPPSGKTWALHHCDNPPCILGEHLYWGDVANNTQDMGASGVGSRLQRMPTRSSAS